MNKEFIKKHFPWFLDQYNSYPQNIQRADVIRYFILYEMGGLYVDLDFECLKSLGDLIEDTEGCLLGLEPDVQSEAFKMEKIICNAWMASSPKHDFFKAIITNLSQYAARSDVLGSTGPIMLTNVYDAAQYDNVKLFPSEFLYPLSVVDSRNLALGLTTETIKARLANAFAVHYFVGSFAAFLADKYFTLGNRNLKPIFITLELPITDYLQIFHSITTGKVPTPFLSPALKWLEKVYKTNQHKKIYLEPGFSELMNELWFTVCFQSYHLGLISWYSFWSSYLGKYSVISLRKKIKFALIFFYTQFVLKFPSKPSHLRSL